jgi:hypothetical protein
MVMERVGTKAQDEEPRSIGDPSLLEFKMSDAAERYGVSATVIPHRIRKVETEKANA